MLAACGKCGRAAPELHGPHLYTTGRIIMWPFRSATSMAASSEDTPFTWKKPRYDPSTFMGRFRHFMDMSDPRCLAPKPFFGVSMQECHDIVREFKATGSIPNGVSNTKMWLAKKVYTSAYHADTDEKIPAPLRMCGYAVFNSPVIVGMLIPNPTLMSIVLWQGANQTHNAAVNYANRNASHPTPMSALLRGYFGAVFTSVTIAVGLNEGVKRSPLSASAKTLLSRFVPYPAVATASTCNMLLMRMGELNTGIHVKSEDGEVLGTSQEAAKIAIYQTMLTRIILPAPLLITPPVLMLSIGNFTPLFKKFPRTRLPVEATICFFAFVYGLPMALSLFPQEVTVAVTELEERFHNLKDANGQPVTEVVFNKGL